MRSPDKVVITLLRPFLDSGVKGIEDGLFLKEKSECEAILQYARSQLVAGYVAFELNQSGLLEKLPDPYREIFSGELLSAAWANRVKYLEFGKINRLFSEIDIPVMPLKGLCLSEVLFHKEEDKIRTMSDIDLLLRESDVPRARKILSRQGYRSSPDPYAGYDAICAEAFGRMNLKKGDLRIDLQWRPRFSINAKLVEWEPVGVWKRSQAASHLGPNVSFPDPVDHGRFLFLQMANDQTCGQLFLRQLLDLAMLIRQFRLSAAEILAGMPALDAKQDGVIQLLSRAAQECFFEDHTGEFSPQTKGLLDSLAAGRPVHKDYVYGGMVLKAPIPFTRKIQFLIGYLFPKRHYLKKIYGGGFWKSFVLGYPRHLFALLTKVFRFLASSCRNRL